MSEKYILCVDNTVNMLVTQEKTNVINGMSCWSATHEYSIALLNDKKSYDLYLINEDFENFKKFSDIDNSTQLLSIFNQNRPTALKLDYSEAIKDIMNKYKESEENSINVIFITSSTPNTPDDEEKFSKCLVNLIDSEKIKFKFIQIGNNPKTTVFLQNIIDNMNKWGLKYPSTVKTYIYSDENTAYKYIYEG